MNRARRHLVGLGWSIGGTVLVCAALILMNHQGNLADNAGPSGTAIGIERASPRQQVAAPKPKPRPKRPQRAAPAPLSGLDSSLAGLDFGLPQFDDAELEGPESLLGETDAAVMTDESADHPPRPVLQTPMAFPAAAKARGITGYVILSLLISPDGAVEKVRIIEAAPPGVFDEVAAAGVQTWRFEPATYRGEPVRVWARQKVSFNLG